MNYRKNFLLVALLSLALVAVVGCGESPTSTVKKFYTAVDSGDSKTLEQVAGPGAGMLASPLGKTAVMQNGMPKSYSQTVNGNSATVTVTFENGQTEQFPVSKVNGKWQMSPPR